MNFPDKKYSVIYADPPWAYTDKHHGGGSLRHYSTMSVDDICNMPVADIADTPSLLFVWVTFPLMPIWNHVIESWGFKYKTLGFSWTKTYPKSGKIALGAGSYTRSNNEVCLIGVRGKGASLIKDRSIPNAQIFPRREHSRKPDEFRLLIDRLVGDVPKIELFSRTNAIDGWDVWGNETDKFDK